MGRTLDELSGSAISFLGRPQAWLRKVCAGRGVTPRIASVIIDAIESRDVGKPT